MILELVKIFTSIPFVLSFIVASISLYYYRIWQLKRVMPPGPWPLPILGNFLALRGNKTLYGRMWELSKIYGDPFTLWLGTQRFVFCSKKETVRGVLIKKQKIYCSRQESVIFNYYGTLFVLAKYGRAWRVQRKLASRSIRNVMSKGLEPQVEKALEQGIEDLKSATGPVNISNYLGNIVFNVMSEFVFGNQYKIHDPVFHFLMRWNGDINARFIKAGIFDVLPFAEQMPLRWIPVVKSLQHLLHEMIVHVSGRIEEHKQTYRDGVVRDFVDAMIAEQLQLEQEGDEDAKFVRGLPFVILVMDAFTAGTDTTHSTLNWLFLFLTLNPEIQEQCYSEISKEVGDREIQLEDRPRLPFLVACIWETLRMRMPVPLGLPHVNIREDTIGPYTIPKGTPLVPNLYAMHMDPNGDFSTNVNEFDPATHFMSNGELDTVQGHNILPFGGGRRVCLGERLARNELFLIASRVIQKFKLSRVAGQTYTTDSDPNVEALLYAHPYTVILESRH